MKIPVGNAASEAAKLGQRDFKPANEPEERTHLVEKFGDERAGQVPCPMLSILLMEDKLVPDADGNVDVSDLKKALGEMNIAAIPRHGLGAFSAKSLSGSFFARQVNVFELMGSAIDHKGSLGALQDGGWNQQLHDQVKACSQDGKTLTLEDLATAQLLRLEQDDAGFRDKLIGRAELTALLLVFGTPNDDGVKSISLDDWDTIFKENRIPDSWQQNTAWTGNLAWGMTKMAFLQNTTAAGRAEKGLKDGLELPEPLGASASLMGLGAMCPAGMRPKGGVGVSEPEIDKLHQALIPDPAQADHEQKMQAIRNIR